MKTQLKNIGILGCGWLGTPLASKLIKKGFMVKGSTTNFNKVKLLKSMGIKPYKIELLPGSIIGDINSFLNDLGILIVNIPPNLSRTSAHEMLNKLENLIREIEKSTVEKVFFISSTSVYKDTEEFEKVIESTIYLDASEKSKALVDAENLFLINNSFKTVVIRFSGLIGPNRHPAIFLSGKPGIKNPNAPINLIHLSDCIMIIEKFLGAPELHGIYNASYPINISRKAYYFKKCEELKIAPPKFDFTAKEFGKKVSSKKLQDALRFKFHNSIL